MGKVKKWNDFLLEYVDVKTLKYYIFDWDDNILTMQTPLHYQHFENGKWLDVKISSHQFAEIRKKYPHDYLDNIEWKGDPNKTFIEFRDFGPRGDNAFLDDVKHAITNKSFGPSWDAFIDTLKKGRLFAIITTRGHEPQTIRFAVQYIIDNVLSQKDRDEMIKNLKNFNELFNLPTNDVIKQYLDNCYFMGIMSQAFEDDFHYIPVGSKANQGKQDAINKFTNYVREFSKKTRIPLHIGFSDDDINYSNAAKELFMGMEKSLDFPENFYVFDTSDRNIKGGVKLKI
jgi:hypothetical protein